MTLSGIVAAVLALLKIVSTFAGPIVEAMDRRRRNAEDETLRAQKDKITQAIEDAQKNP